MPPWCVGTAYLELGFIFRMNQPQFLQALSDIKAVIAQLSSKTGHPDVDASKIVVLYGPEEFGPPGYGPRPQKSRTGHGEGLCSAITPPLEPLPACPNVFQAFSECRRCPTVVVVGGGGGLRIPPPPLVGGCWELIGGCWLGRIYLCLLPCALLPFDSKQQLSHKGISRDFEKIQVVHNTHPKPVNFLSFWCASIEQRDTFPFHVWLGPVEQARF